MSIKLSVCIVAYNNYAELKEAIISYDNINDLCEGLIYNTTLCELNITHYNYKHYNLSLYFSLPKHY